MGNKQSSANLLEQVKSLEGVSFNYSVIDSVGLVQDGFGTREEAREYKRNLESSNGDTGVKILQHKTITTYIR